MKRNYKEKLFKSLISIGVIGALLLLISVPFISRFNYSPFNILAVNITPSQDYKIQFDLPHIKPISASQREKAEKNLSKVFGIKLSNLKDNEAFLSKPNVEIKLLPITGKYAGSIKIGNLYIPFTKITKQFTVNNKNNELPSKILLTVYYTLNSKVLRANIFIINNGSVLKYASMTIQDKDDNVLAMFTYGKAERPHEMHKDITSNKQINKKNTIRTGSTYPEDTTESTVNDGEVVLRSFVKDITIGTAESNETRTVHGLRTDAMEEYPFSTANRTLNMLSLRTWGFRKPIVDAYKSIYTDMGYNPSDITVNLGASGINNVIETKYQSTASTENDEQLRFPLPSGYSTIPISVNFVLYKNFSISYIIHLPYGGVKKTWTYKQTTGQINGYYNYAEFNADPFYNQWNEDKLFWPDTDSNPYIQSPGSSYGGFYTRQSFLNHCSGSDFEARYTSSYMYTVTVDLPLSTTDYYYFSVYNTFDNVRLDY